MLLRFLPTKDERILPVVLTPFLIDALLGIARHDGREHIHPARLVAPAGSGCL